MAPPVQPLAVRFERWSAPVTESGCLIWLGKWDWQGYGHIKHKGRDRKAATVAYEMAKGDVPKGLELHHTCHVRACVNADHLVLTTRSENSSQRRPYTLPSRRRSPEERAAYQAEWRSANKERIAQYARDHKDRINAQRRERRNRKETF